VSQCQIWSKSVKMLPRYDDFSIFPRWRPSAILDLLCVSLYHPRRAFGGLYRCAKFGWNRCSSFDNMHVFRFCEFGWKTPIRAPKIGFLGDLTP